MSGNNPFDASLAAEEGPEGRRSLEDVMIRFTLAASFLLSGSLLASPSAIGQEPPKAKPPAEVPAGQANPAAEAQAKAGLLKLKIVDEEAANPAEQYPNVSFIDVVRGQPRKVVANFFDALETNFGLSLADADDTLRAQLEIAPGEGVVVVGVKDGSLAESAGLKLNDILLKLGDQPAKGVDEVRKVLLGLGKEALEVKLIREGKARRMSLVGPEHGFPPEAAEFWIGVPVSPVDATLRAHLPTLSAESGLIVNDVVKGSPADQVSVKKDDVLVSMDGKPLPNSDALIAQIQATKGKAVPLEILRAGKPLTITITPAKRSHPTVINVKPNSDVQFLYRMIQPGMAIEVNPQAPHAPAAKDQATEKKIEMRNVFTGQNLFVDPTANQKFSVLTTPSPSGNYTLFAPYTGIVHDPYASTTFTAPTSPPNFPTWAYTNTINPDPSTARIEAQLKEVVTKLEEINKALEALKKPAGK